ncbi:hypothetical protein [Pseudorhodobacter sp.]|uniref:hypothetical protein n=1 Tax=Pseudorhodobacter sp. TaxID=1934400 RepID=UPI002AFFA015|nr:hypothetical protein [Pseudorhodobacter sp.]
MGMLKPATNIKISQADALKIFEWLHGKSGLKTSDMTKEDQGMAQTIMVEMLDASFAVGFIEALFRSSVKVPSGPAAVIKAFLKGAGKNLLKYKDKDDIKKMLKKPIIYKMIYNTVKLKTKSLWAIRISIGEW